MSRGPSGPIRPRMVALAAKARACATLRSALGGTALLTAATLLLIAFDAVAPLPAGLRLAALVVLAALAGAAAWHLRRGLRHLPPEAMAQRAEGLSGIRDNALINACQFEAMTLPAAQAAWVPPTSASAAVALERVSVPALLDLPRLLRAGLAALAAGSLLCVGIIAWPDHLRHGALRLALPLADLPPLGQAVISLTPAAQAEVVDGGALRLVVRVRPVDHRRLELPAPTLQPEEDGSLSGELRQAKDGAWIATLDDLHRSVALRVACAGSLSPLLRVTVLPPPALTASRFVVDGPAYAGITADRRAGPPAALAILPGATVRIEVAADRVLPALRWRVPGAEVDLKLAGDLWSGSAVLATAGPYSLVVPGPGGDRVIARGEVRIEADRPPEATLGGTERNRYVEPGASLELPVGGHDDHGLAAVTVEVREAIDGSKPATVRTWNLLGPPGPADLSETLRLQIDPARFQPGRAYVLEAVATDRKPQSGRSAPLVLRIRAVADLALPDGDRRAAAFEQLRRCLAEQVRTRAATGNARANLAEIRSHRSMPAQAEALRKAQEAARATGQLAVEAFAKVNEGAVLAQLKPIVDPEMVHLRDELAALGDPAAAEKALPGLIARQDDLIARLTAMLGSIVAESRQEKTVAAKPTADQQEADRKKAEELKQDLERFLADQRRILERSRSLADGGGADLTADEERIAGELSKAEKDWAKFLEEKLTNFAQNPPQDFSDASLASETNAVWQDVKLAADALDGKKIELAVPREQMGIENAETLVNNLEKWLSDAPDKLKWEMEDAPAPADVAVAELPAELEDIVGDLLDKAEEMTPDIQDTTSAWMDSLDKGAGWTAADGPISNMSAKGITGNVLPNQSEIGGRSGEGRNGRSNGQMVQDEAVGKGGQETPTRLSQTPFEQGSVKDSSTESGGGATGGGKLSGFDAEGLRGPTPPPQLQQTMARLAGKQQELRQQAETLALGLRARRLPSAGVESAVVALDAAADAARRFDGGQLKQAHTRLLDDLASARRDVAAASAVRQERSKLGDRARAAAAAGAEEAVPPGYEDMAGRYFQALAGEK